MVRAVAMVRLARPLILPGGILAYTLGTTMGYAQSGQFRWDRALAGLAVTEVANLMAHYADEYADRDADMLTRRTWFSGGSGVLPSGVVPASWALCAALLCAVLAVVLAAGALATGLLGWQAAAIAGCGLACGWVYSMPPVALERRGLGELDNAFIGGILMPLMGYVTQARTISPAAMIALLPIFLAVLAGLLPVHWADRFADAAVGKRSLAVLLGPHTPALHHLLIALSYLLAAAFAGRLLPVPAAVAMLLTLPLGLWATVGFGRRTSPVAGSLAMAGTLLATAVGWLVAV